MNLSKASGPSSGSPPDYIWIDTSEAYERMLASRRGVPRFAIDIEADSLYHYFEKVCLIQISTDADTFILDPLALPDLSALAPLLEDPDVEKVLHAAGYDVACLRRDFDFTFRNIFDTHVAARLLGFTRLGLSALMEAILGVTHSKRRQRDDWSRRPLDPEQLEYAAMDTHHLLELRDILEGQLREKGRLRWALEEFEAAAVTESRDKEFDPEGYRSIKGSRRLSSKEAAALRGLYHLRDHLARIMDLPPFKVLTNQVLLQLARNPPATPDALFHRPGISQRLAREYSEAICRSIEESRAQPLHSKKQAPRPTGRIPPHEAKVRLERLKSWRKSKSKELDLHVGVVFPGSWLETIAMHPPDNGEDLENLQGMRRWRAREFGDEILSILHSPLRASGPSTAN